MNPLLLGLLLVVPPPDVPPSVNLTVDCTGITVASADWPEGTTAQLGMDSSPPLFLAVNGTVHWDWRGPTIEGKHGGGVIFNDGTYRYLEAACESAVDIPAAEPAPVPMAPVAQVTTVELVESPWVGVELAPPW